MATARLAGPPSFFSDDSANTANAPAAGISSGAPGQPSPTSAPQAAGTGLGQAVRAGLIQGENTALTGISNARQAAVGATNLVTAPARAVGGFARDFFNGLAGNPASPNAGQPLAGFALPSALPKLSGLATTAAAAPTPASPAAPAIPAAPAGVAPAQSGRPAAPNFSGVQSGVSTYATLQPPGAAAAPPSTGVDLGNGRHLPYGAMVNGVPTFSDGSSGQPGVAGTIPRTMSDDQIASLGKQLNTVPAANFARPTSGEVLGYTPTSEQMASLIHPAQPITGSRPSEADFAQSRLLDIANRDPRSAAGIAAGNLATEAQYGGTGRVRRMAEQGLAALTQGAQAIAQQQIGAQAAADQAASQNAAQLGLENLRGQYGLAQTAEQAQVARLNRPLDRVTMADGTIGVLDPWSRQVNPAINADGSVAKTLVAKDDSTTKRANELADQRTRRTNDLMDQITKNAAKLQEAAALSGTPPNIGDLRLQAASLAGLPTATNKTTGAHLVKINGQWMPL